MTTIDMVAPTNSHNGSVTTIEQPPTLEERIANLEALVSEMSTTPTEEINA